MMKKSTDIKFGSSREAFKREALRLIRFLIIGAVNTAFGFLTYALLLFATNNNHIASIIIGTCINALFNYFSTGKIVFFNKGLGALPKFLGGYVVALLAQLVVVETLTRYEVSALAAGAISLPFIIVCTYIYNWAFVFKEARNNSQR